MRFTIQIDMTALAGEPADEIARILRYWAGALPQLDLTAEQEQPLSDSAYNAVGTLWIAPEGAR